MHSRHSHQGYSRDGDTSAPRADRSPGGFAHAGSGMNAMCEAERTLAVRRQPRVRLFHPCTQPGPLGGLAATVGRHGVIKPDGARNDRPGLLERHGMKTLLYSRPPEPG